jgi:hypothetical protein
MWKTGVIGALLFAATLAACGGKVRAGASCTDDLECRKGDVCVKDFAGGYCGKKGCTGAADCPKGTICAALTLTNTGTPTPANYCLLSCDGPEDEICVEDRFDRLNLEGRNILPKCSSEITRVGGDGDACVPPTCTTAGSCTGT